MSGTIREWWDVLLHIIGSLGELWQTALVCLLLSMAATQWIKPWLCRPMSKFKRNRILQLTAFVVGAIPVWVTTQSKGGFIVGALVGVASPIVFQVLQWMVRKRWPDLADAISADSPHYKLSDYWQGQRPSPPEHGSESPRRASKRRN